MSRRHIGLSTDELISLAKANWDDPSVLSELANETDHRKAKRARMLARDLQKRLAVLAGTRAKDSRSSNQQRTSLETQLKDAYSRIKTLERVLASLRANGRSPVDLILAKWGLTSGCPPAIFEAARRAWRKQLHPDAHADKAPGERRALEQRFQEFEQDSDRLLQLGWPS